MTINLSTPLSTEQISNLHTGDVIHHSGIIVTGRDRVHRWLAESCAIQPAAFSIDYEKVRQTITKYLDHGVIFHCGPIVSGSDRSNFKIVSAGPTTSVRTEPFMADIIRQYNLKAVIGKGGMGEDTSRAMQEVKSVYFHAIGGAGASIAQCVDRIVEVQLLEFGIPEAMWVLEVKSLPLIVTMDSNGNSLHEVVRSKSKVALQRLISEK